MPKVESTTGRLTQTLSHSVEDGIDALHIDHGFGMRRIARGHPGRLPISATTQRTLSWHEHPVPKLPNEQFKTLCIPNWRHSI